MAEKGRVPKLTPEVQKIICAIMTEVGDLRIASRGAGVGYSTVKSWKAKGRQQKSGKYKRFLDALEESMDKCEYRLRRRIWTSEEWRASAWALKHMRPRKYADTAKLEHTGKGGSPLPDGPRTVIYLPDNGRLPQDVDV